MSADGVDFERMADADLARFAAAHSDEFGAEIDPLHVIAAVSENRAAIVRRAYGFAVVLLMDGKLPHLWLLYVAAAQRGRGLGRQFVRELRKQFDEFHMSLRCEGAARRRFFSRCGFVVESRDGEWRRMTTDHEWRRWA